jgi:iron complex transport system substrate-binding protein
LTAAQIDAAVREHTERGEAIYELDAARLQELEPDLIVTQALCPVCAVSVDDVRAVAGTIPSRPHVVALDPHTLGESFGDVRTVAQLTRSRDAALDLIARQRARIDAVKIAVRKAERVPVAAIEWLDPVFVAGHWTPQLIDLAGGIDVLGFPGEPSEQSTWETVAAAAPRVVVAMPCGYDAERSRAGRAPTPTRCDRGAERVVAVDASATLAPRARLVDGLAHGLPHPAPPTLVLRASTCVLGGRGPSARDRTVPGTGRSWCCPTTARWRPICARPRSRCSCARWRCCGAPPARRRVTRQAAAASAPTTATTDSTTHAT